MISDHRFNKEKSFSYNFQDDASRDLYETITSEGESDVFSNILYAESPELSQETKKLNIAIEKASKIFNEQIEKMLEPLKEHLYSVDPREQWQSFHDLLKLYTTRYFADTHQAGEVAKKILKNFITETDTEKGAYYYARYYKSFLEEENSVKINPREILLPTGGMLLLSKDKAIILEAQDYSDYTKLNEQIDIYDNLKNPDRWISETFTKPNGSVQTKEYLERDPYNEQIDKEISRLKKQIWTLKQKAMSNPIDQKSLGLVGNDIDQSDIKDYMDIVISTLKTSIEDDFSIALDDMPLDLQMQFIKFIKHANKAIIERTQKIGAVHQQNFYTSFLALAHGGPEMGDKILDIGEKLPENIAQKIFQKYADLVRINEKIVDFITDQYNTEISENPKIIEETRTKLFHKGIDILNNFHKRIPKDAPLLDEIYQNLESDLATLQAETFAKLSAFKYARKYGATYELSDIQNADLSVYTPQQLVQRGHHKRMRAIYEGNWKNAYDPKIYAELESIFMKSFDGSSDSEEKNNFYVFTIDDQIESFVRFEKKEDGTVYASALNVDPHKHGLSLGEVVMAQSLAKEAESHILDAKCIPTEMNSARYIEMGFVGHASENFQGIDIMHISWNKNKNEDLVSKKLSPLEIAQMAHGDIPTPETLRIYRADHQHDFHFLKDQGYVLSRYFKNKDGWYCVYESVNIDDYRSSEIDSD